MVLFGTIGGVLVSASTAMFERRIAYKAGDSALDLQLESDVEGPVHISYVLHGFFANNKAYVESKDNFLIGSMASKYTCQGSKSQADVQWRRGGDEDYLRLLHAGEFRPCGLVAMSMFFDEYKLVNLDTNETVSLDRGDLALAADADIFKDIVAAGDTYTVEGVKSWLRPAFYEDFKVWYRQPVSPAVRNLWARIPHTLKAGRYQIRFVRNSELWTNAWGVEEKEVVLSESHVLGGPGGCRFLGILCLIACAIELVLTLALLFIPDPESL